MLNYFHKFINMLVNRIVKEVIIMKVIFLDIDGVLNSNHWYIRNHKKHPEKCRTHTAIDPRYIKNLRKIVKKTDAKIVLTSTQRSYIKRHDDCLLKQIFTEYGLEIFDYIPILIAQPRGCEIQKWLNEHTNVTSFIILDDSSDMAHLLPYLVKTYNCFPINLPLIWYFYEGLSTYKTNQAIKMLNSKK